jgi:hypothetical protein
VNASTAIYFVNTYDSKGRPFEEDSAVFSAAELGDAEALRQANEAYDWYLERGAAVKLLKVT